MSLSHLMEGLPDTHFIDYSQIVISNIMYHFDDEDAISPKIVRNIIIDTIRSHVIKNKQEYPNVVIGVDSSEGYWRSKLAYYYKKNRIAKKEGSARDWNSIYSAMNAIRQELIDHLPYKTIYVPGAEADDTFGVLIKYFKEQDPGVKILITSADGDFTQLQRFSGVKQWNPMHKKWVKPEHGSPERDLLYKIVKGDAKDGIANIYSPSDILYKNSLLEKEERTKQKSIRKELIASVFAAKDPKSLFTGEVLDRYNENEKLIDLKLIPDDLSDKIIQEYENFKPAPRGRLTNYFIKSGMVEMIGKESEF
ncbi:ribonuclease [Aeromonas phage ZPAH1]|nr:ribonuclease [Aeromonas phage ZPAH1]